MRSVVLTRSAHCYNTAITTAHILVIEGLCPLVLEVHTEQGPSGNSWYCSLSSELLQALERTSDDGETGQQRREPVELKASRAQASGLNREALFRLRRIL